MPSNTKTDHYRNQIYLDDDDFIYVSDEELQQVKSWVTKKGTAWTIKKGISKMIGMPSWILTAIEKMGQVQGYVSNKMREKSIKQTNQWVQQGKMSEDEAYDYVLDKDLDYY
ncbi:hypothetical protein FDP41_008760 [Naegleria fowleri]|uniref:Uncharacterized protein n=1 Tax=Naegleria fowleri TaxID=5763 RepID=A0A6A5BG06_NAEFO|nr:uncharacterized protein FDP41_008760 [Naegleria fowleri]KAF0972908.1 hypothetical protein FDP41_008760 [Naegleria fowleri]CAG4714891.1 unnamed protein product [Naegleria fowleri]